MAGDVLEEDLTCTTPNICFAPIEATQVAKRAALFDTVLVVADPYSVADRIDLYETLGVNVNLYPYTPLDAPTIISVLGLLAWLEKEARRGRVLVEGFGGERLVMAAYLVYHGLNVEEVLSHVAKLGGLHSPLHLRLLLILWALSRELDLKREASQYIEHAFTGGDAHLAWVIELAVEHYLQLHHLLPIRLAQLYYSIIGHKHVRLNDVEKSVLNIAESLDYTLVGAIRNVAVSIGVENLEIHVGCQLLDREGQCWPEAEKAKLYYDQLARLLGVKDSSFTMTTPEEAACIAYGDYAPDLCAREDTRYD